MRNNNSVKKRTVVLGASPNPSRYAYFAVRSLTNFGHEAIPVGVKKGSIEGIEIINGKPPLEEVDTVTLYLNPERQKEYYDYINRADFKITTEPRRIIFNPGTENPELARLAEANGITVEIACTLVMLTVGTF